MDLQPCTRKGTVLVQDDHVALAGDVAFHEALCGESVDGIPDWKMRRKWRDGDGMPEAMRNGLDRQHRRVVESSRKKLDVPC